MPYSTVTSYPVQQTNDILSSATELLKERLYFITISHHPLSHPNVHYFSIDHTFVYSSFYSDFGPNNLGHVVQFCDMIKNKFQQQNDCVYTLPLNQRKRPTRPFFWLHIWCKTLLQMLVQKKSPEDSVALFSSLQFAPYRDAGYGAATYYVTILDCLKGLHKALSIGLVQIDDLNTSEYEFYERVENGDLNWVTGKFIAMANPKEPPENFRTPVQQGYSSFVPKIADHTNSLESHNRLYPAYCMDDLIRLLKERGVTTVIRLNNKTYDNKKFIDAGLEHIELYFPDGTTPPDTILRKFMDICESRKGVIAVHCKAGLGRTGTLISCFLMKHYKFSAAECIGLLRVLRPGSVVGPQQNYLQGMQMKLWRMHPFVKLSPEVAMQGNSIFPESIRYPCNEVYVKPAIGNSESRPASRSVMEIGKITQEGSKYAKTYNHNIVSSAAIEQDLTIEDADQSRPPTSRNNHEEISLVNVTLNALSTTDELEIPEGGGVQYNGYTIPLQPRKTPQSQQKRSNSSTTTISTPSSNKTHTILENIVKGGSGPSSLYYEGQNRKLVQLSKIGTLSQATQTRRTKKIGAQRNDQMMVSGMNIEKAKIMHRVQTQNASNEQAEATQNK